MKTIRNSLVWLVASVVLAGAALAQDKSELFHQGLATNSVAGAAVTLGTEPKLVLRSGTEVTGLFVDLLKPRQTWLMLNPPVPVRDLPKPIPPYLLPVKPLLPINDDLAVHDAGFALFRFTFR